jgi:hypothetical protein
LKPLKPIIFAALAAAIVFAVYSVFFPPAEKVIAKRIRGLGEAISARPGGNIGKVANVSKIGSYFHPEVRIALQGFGREVASISGRGELEQAALAARNTVGSVAVKFYNLSILVGPSKTNATVTLTALVNINDQPDPAMQEIRFEMEKAGRQWLIRTASPAGRQLQIE